MAELADIVFDCSHPASLARFWATALNGYDLAPYDDAELERLRAVGITDPEDDPTVLLEPRHGGPRIWFQQVPEPKSAKNRVHLDISAADTATEIDRLVAFGATVVERQNRDLCVLQDPEGNEFCVISQP